MEFAAEWVVAGEAGPPGSFFAHEASQANAAFAASQWPVVQQKVASTGVRLIEMTVPNATLRSLQAQGLVRVGAVPGLPFFPMETVFSPEALEALNGAATFRVLAGAF
jgi:hypothetical protein